MKTSSGLKGDQDSPNRHAASRPTSYLITVAAEQVRLAGRERNRGWPSNSAPHPEGNPTEVNHDPVCNPKKFWPKAADEGWVTGTAMDPLATAVKAARAKLVGPGEFRALEENAPLLRPLLGSGFQVWELPNRLARD